MDANVSLFMAVSAWYLAADGRERRGLYYIDHKAESDGKLRMQYSSSRGLPLVFIVVKAVAFKTPLENVMAIVFLSTCESE